MDRDPKFVDMVFQNELEKGSEHWTLRGPSTGAIGWIPFYGAGEALSKPEWRSAFDEELPVRLLFATGNPDPQPEFSGPIRFADRLRLGDFRAALAIRTPILVLNRQRRPIQFRFGQFVRVGRTPLPFGRESFQVQLAGRSSGDSMVGGAKPQVRFSRDGVELQLDYLFKLGLLADLAGAVLTRKLAPFAWIQLKYRISCDGYARMEIQHSAVPSVRWYLEKMDSDGTAGEWAAIETNLMEQRMVKEFREFVDTDSSERGPRGGMQSLNARCCIQQSTHSNRH